MDNGGPSTKKLSYETERTKVVNDVCGLGKFRLTIPDDGEVFGRRRIWVEWYVPTTVLKRRYSTTVENRKGLWGRKLVRIPAKFNCCYVSVPQK